MGQGAFRTNKLVALRHYMVKSNAIAYILEEKSLSRNLETLTAIKNLWFQSNQYESKHNQRSMNRTGHIPLKS